MILGVAAARDVDAAVPMGKAAASLYQAMASGGGRTRLLGNAGVPQWKHLGGEVGALSRGGRRAAGLDKSSSYVVPTHFHEPSNAHAARVQGQAVSRQHGLDRPDGRPLYGYRLSDAGFIALRTLIGRWHVRPQMMDPASRYMGAVFCLFIAEWFRRDFQEGHWSWDVPCGAVGLAKEFPTLHALTAIGLGFWRQGLLRGPDNSREYLHSLIVQGGTPTAFAARGEGWLSAYVRAVMDDLETGADLSSEQALRHARFHDHRVPVSFCVAPIVEIVAQLSARLAELRYGARAGAGLTDVVGWLDGFSPSWRESSPIAMADASAARLIEGLVRLRPDAETGGTVTVGRLLLRDPAGGGYRFAARLSLDGTLDLTQPLSSDAFADLMGRTRARLFPSGATAERVTGCLAILEPPAPDAATGRVDGRRPWSARAVLSESRSLLAPFPFEADVEVRLHADNRDAAAFVLPAGRRVLESVLSFRAVDDESPPRELRLIGSGSVRTREPDLYFTARCTPAARAARSCGSPAGSRRACRPRRCV